MKNVETDATRRMDGALYASAVCPLCGRESRRWFDKGSKPGHSSGTVDRGCEHLLNSYLIAVDRVAFDFGKRGRKNV